MALYALGDIEPEIDPDAFVHPDATIIGNVVVGAGSTIWPQAVLRGDQSRIVIGARTSVQDGAVLHCTRELETTVGDDCTIGHLAHLEGCVVEDGALVGTGSIVLHRAVIRTGALVGAGALVPGGMEVPGGAMALGVPAKVHLDRVRGDQITYPGVRVRAQLGALPQGAPPHRLSAVDPSRSDDVADRVPDAVADQERGRRQHERARGRAPAWRTAEGRADRAEHRQRDERDDGDGRDSDRRR